MSIKVIAYYLPQFHPTTDNDAWWGKGFTEWTNVGKAKPLFRGHYQPRVPADLGYYDLRLPEVREQQVELAKEAGVHGFCYWHYWFGNGKRLLERPFQEVLESRTPDFPFCLGWANESWKAKYWGGDGKIDRDLIVQIYPGLEDYSQHFNCVLPAFLDPRYIKVDEKPVFLIYQPLQIPDLPNFIKYWNKLAEENGLKGIHFIARAAKFSDYKQLVDSGFDAVTLERIRNAYTDLPNFKKALFRLRRFVRKRPSFQIPYETAIQHFSNENEDSINNVYPSVIPCWDHSPRSGARGTILDGSTPELFTKHLKQVFKIVRKKQQKDQIVFLKSWNEWAEGNYMEPDLIYGKGYIKALKSTLSENK